MKKNGLKWILFVLLGVVLVACGGSETEDTAVSSETTEATATATESAVLGGGSTEESTAVPAEATAVPATEEPTVEPTVESTAPPEVATNECLIGTWQISNFETYLLASMMQAVPEGSNISIEVGETSGALFLIFTKDEMSMDAEDFVVRLSVAGQDVETAIEAVGVANYVADATTITGTATEYDSTGTETNTGQTVTIDIADFATAGADGGTVEYTCSGDEMVWSGPFATPIEMMRVD